MGSTQMRQAGQAACCGGAFAFVLMFTFSPLGLTALASGDELALDPFAQTMLGAAEMVAIMAALVLAAGPAPRGTGRLARVLARTCPLAGCALACAVQLPWVPVAVALLMGAGAAAQLFLCAGACARMPLGAVMVGSAAALALAVAASVAARAWPQAWQGTAFLAAVAFACAVAFCLLGRPVRSGTARTEAGGGAGAADAIESTGARTRGEAANAEVIAAGKPGKARTAEKGRRRGAEGAGLLDGAASGADAAENGRRCATVGAGAPAETAHAETHATAAVTAAEPAGLAGEPSPQAPSGSPDACLPLLPRLAQALAPLRYDWQPLAGGAVCALSFGFVWNQPVVDMSGAQLVGSCLGRIVGAAALAAMFVPRAGRVSHAAFTGALAVTAALGTFVWSASSGVLDSPFFMAVACASQTLFVGLLWLETLFTSRDQRRAEALPLAGMSAFLLAFILGGAVSQVLSPAATTACVPTLLLAYLVALVLAGLRGAGTQTEDAPAGDTVAAAGQAPAPSPATEASRGYDELFRTSCGRLAQRHALSPREAEVLPLLVTGMSSTAIGASLFISPHTVKTHAHRIYGKMGIHSHDELVELFGQALEEGGAPAGMSHLQGADRP